MSMNDGGDKKDDDIQKPSTSKSNTNIIINNNKQETKKSQEEELQTNNDTRACAACKYQRRRCVPGCVLAPYFPPDNQKQFLNAHKLFGVRNMMKVYNCVKPKERNDAMKSMIYQANVRAQDPVGGCHRLILGLEKQIKLFESEFYFVSRQLALRKNLNNINTSSCSESMGIKVNPPRMGFNPSTSVRPGYNNDAPQSMPMLPMLFQNDAVGCDDFDFLLANLLGYKSEGIEAITTLNPPAQAPLLLNDESKDVKPDLMRHQNLNRSSEKRVKETLQSQHNLIIKEDLEESTRFLNNV